MASLMHAVVMRDKLHLAKSNVQLILTTILSYFLFSNMLISEWSVEIKSGVHFKSELIRH